MTRFQEGDVLVIPHHGVCRVLGYQKSQFHPSSITPRVEYLMLERVSDNEIFALDSARLEEKAVRTPLTVDSIPSLIEQLSTPPRHISTLWARRWRTHAALLNTGDVLDLACVVRNMYHFAQTSTLSAAEKAMSDRALTNLTNEVAHSTSSSEESAATLITDALKAGLNTKRKPKKV
jgi:CarD family transcriptional regulator